MTDLEPILERLGLQQYYEVFIEEGFETWETLLDIQETDLEALEVKLGHRRRLQRAIAEYRGYSGDRPLGSSPQDAYGQDLAKLETGVLQTVSSRENLASAIVEPKRKYRRRPKADENAPEKPPSAYVLFSNKVRDEVRNQNLSFTEIARLVGERWQKLNPAQKEPFETYATSLKDTYNSQLAEYKKSDAYREYAKYLADFKVKHGEMKGDSKRLKLEAEYGNPWAGSSSAESTETASHTSRHTRGGSAVLLPSIPSSMHGSAGSTSLHVLTSLPKSNVADRRRLSPSHRQTTRLQRSPPGTHTPPPLTTRRRSERPDVGHGSSSPTWPRQSAGSYTGSAAPSESPTKTLGSLSFSTSPEEIQRERLQDLERSSQGTMSSAQQLRSQQQQQSPIKGSLPISHLVGPNVDPDSILSTSQRVLPLPYSSAGSQPQQPSTIFGRTSGSAMVSPFQTMTERGPLPQRYASSTRRRSDDEAASDLSDVPETQSSNRGRRYR